MEVHHHPHVEKKSLREYSTQFILPQMTSEATQFTTICKDYYLEDRIDRNKKEHIKILIHSGNSFFGLTSKAFAISKR